MVENEGIQSLNKSLQKREEPNIADEACDEERDRIKSKMISALKDVA